MGEEHSRGSAYANGPGWGGGSMFEEQQRGYWEQGEQEVRGAEKEKVVLGLTGHLRTPAFPHL